MDAARRMARVDGGCTWGDFDHASHAFGLATPGGIISTTGVGGLTLGGGFGYLSRRYGLACDNLISADVVTADGRVVTVSADENPDLFWALRGGGGNFGVVTSFEFRMYPVSTVYMGMALYPLDKAAGAMRLFNDFMAGAPRSDGVLRVSDRLPGPPFPPELQMKTMCGIVWVYSADVESGERLTAPLREFGPPALAMGHPAPYPAVQSMFDALLYPGLQHYWKADFIGELNERIIAEHLRYGPQIPTVPSVLHIYPLDGAIHDVAPDQTAFAYRDAKFTHIIAGVSPEPGPMPEYREWVRAYWSALHPHSAGGAYEFPDGRGRRPDCEQLQGQLRPAGGDQAEIRPGQSVPREPEHTAGSGGSVDAAAGQFTEDRGRAIPARAVSSCGYNPARRRRTAGSCGPSRGLRCRSEQARYPASRAGFLRATRRGSRP